MNTYLAVVREYDDVHVAQAVGRFLRGEVPRENHGFVPSSAQLAIEVRAMADREEARIRLDRLRHEHRAEIEALRRGEELPLTTRAHIARSLIALEPQEPRQPNIRRIA